MLAFLSLIALGISTVQVLPDDVRIEYSGYVQLYVNSDRAHFDRQL